MNTNRLIATTIALSLLAAGGCVGSIGSIGNFGGGITNGGNSTPASNSNQQTPQGNNAPDENGTTGVPQAPQTAPPPSPTNPTSPTPTPQVSSTPAPTEPTSTSPTVTAITPLGGATGVSTEASLVLTFSEQVDKTSVQDNIRIGLAAGSDLITSTGDTIKAFYNAAADNGTSTAIINSGAYLYNRTHLNFTWRADGTQVTISPKEGYFWPSDKNSDLIPSWAVVFDGGIKDVENSVTTSGIFPGGKFGSTFRVAQETTAPSVQSVTALNASGGADDRILVKFSEPMAIFPNAAGIGGAAQLPGGAGYVLNKAFFSIDVAINGVDYTGSFITIGGGTAIGEALNDSGTEVYFDPNDASKKTVVIEFEDGGNAFNVGSGVKVNVSNSATDPAGNTVPSDRDQGSTTAS